MYCTDMIEVCVCVRVCVCVCACVCLSLCVCVCVQVSGVLLSSGCRVLAGVRLARASGLDGDEGSDPYLEGSGRSHTSRKEVQRRSVCDDRGGLG